MLLEFESMREAEMYRMVQEVYPEGSYENAREKYPEAEDLSAAIREEEQYFVDFLKKFMGKDVNRYYILEVDGQWVSALRLTRIDGFYYMESLETAPKYRKKGYAAQLIQEVTSLLKERGSVTIRSTVNKKNVPSLATHAKCGFVIAEENGVNYLTGEAKEWLYGMLYQAQE